MSEGPYALRKRMAKFLLPVLILTVAMNVTKFFEIYIVYSPVPDSATNATRPELRVSEFRMNPTYSIFFNWFRFITIGIIPFCLLVYFNTQVGCVDVSPLGFPLVCSFFKSLFYWGKRDSVGNGVRKIRDTCYHYVCKLALGFAQFVCG